MTNTAFHLEPFHLLAQHLACCPWTGSQRQISHSQARKSHGKRPSRVEGIKKGHAGHRAQEQWEGWGKEEGQREGGDCEDYGLLCREQEAAA